MRLVRCLALLVVLLVALMGCGPAATDSASRDASEGEQAAGGDGSEPPADEGAHLLRIVHSHPIAGIDPADNAVNIMKFGAAETLMQAVDGGEIVPWLAEGLELVDERTWVIELREGVTFQNGNPVDADAVVASMQRQLAEGVTPALLFPEVELEATAELEVTLRTPSADAVVPSKLAEYTGFPIYDVSVFDGDQPLEGSGFLTGPYAPVEVRDDLLLMERFEGHWEGVPPLAGVQLRQVPDAQARIIAVQSGEADIAMEPPSQAQRLLEDDDRAFFVSAPEANAAVRLELNTALAPMDDPEVRRAVALAIDYRQIAEDVLDGVYEVARGMWPSTYDGAIENQPSDPARAADLLDAAGWELGEDGLRTRDGEALRITVLTHPQRPDTEPIAIAVQSQLAEVGIGVDVVQVDDRNAAVAEPDGWHASVAQNSTLSPWTGAPEERVLLYFGADSSSNASRVDDPELEGLVAELYATFDRDDRHDLLARVQELMVEERAYVIVVGFIPVLAVVSPEFIDQPPSTYYRSVTSTTAPG